MAGEPMINAAPTDEDLTARLAAGAEQERLAALAAVARRGDAPRLPSPLAAALLRTLADRSTTVRLAAAAHLTKLCRTSASWRGALETALEAQDERLRWGATYALSVAGHGGPQLFAAAFAALASDDGDVRWAAKKLVVRLLEADAALASRLLQPAAELPPQQRKMVCYCLRDAGVTSAEARGYLLERLTDPAALVRAAAISALGALWPQSEEVAAAFLERLRSEPDGAALKVLVATCGAMRCSAARLAGELAGFQQAADQGLRKAARLALRRLAAAPS
ncbi:MAG: HEAT repeat domain-containing protein [Candidatus Tectomicrobia bacterium]|nr:HEAT repeat domain-containing protein [Candidatus Tectomicrobia bacterium]